jgi:hypothetical protein
MGEIASEQNSTIILPVPIDLFRPFLENQNGSYGESGQRASRRKRPNAATRRP